jgi:long-chain acyl-CoA synthetase
LVIAAALDWSLLRRTYWSGWTGWAFRNPFTRAVSRLAQAVPIDPDRAIVSSLAFSAAVLKRQKNLIWFPEGQRSPNGELQPFRPGIGILLDHFQVPVVPVYIQGTYEALPVGKAVPRIKRISVVFGRPLDPEDLRREGGGDNPQDAIVSALRKQVAELGNQS